MDEFISYNGLPISSAGAHSISNKSSIDLYNEVKIFTETVTDCQKPQYSLLELNSSVYNAGCSISFWKAVKQFGIPTWSFDQYLSSRQHIWTWNINKKLNVALEIVDHVDNLTFLIMWRFKFVDINTKQILPGQDKIPLINPLLHNSQAILRLGKKKTLSLWFAIPSAHLNVNYIKHLSILLPIKFASKHWRIWNLNNNSKWNSKQYIP